MKLPFLFFFSFLITYCCFAQNTSFTLEYLEKAKCKNCILQVHKHGDTLGNVMTYFKKENQKCYKRHAHGYDVSYYANGKPDQVYYYNKDVPNGKHLEFHPNGNIKVKGLYKKALEHGRWIFYDSLGKPEKIIHYKNGNDRSQKIKYNYEFTYGMPMFWSDQYDSCRCSIEEKYHFRKRPIAGCVVSDNIEKIEKKHNRKLDFIMKLRYGRRWRETMKAEIKEKCNPLQ